VSDRTDRIKKLAEGPHSTKGQMAASPPAKLKPSSTGQGGQGGSGQDGSGGSGGSGSSSGGKK
jgi:hypothetical protein